MLRPYLVLSDHLGSTSTTANADGTLHSGIQYTAFGEIRLTQGNTPTQYRYTGQLAQAELGLDYYIARFYDPLTGHFTQADTLIPEPGKASAFDRYAYVLNNPVRYSDPSGHGIDYGISDSGSKIDRSGDLKRWKTYILERNKGERAKKETNITSEANQRNNIFSNGISYSEDHGVCIRWGNIGCSGGMSYEEWLKNEYYPMLINVYFHSDLQNISILSQDIAILFDYIGFHFELLLIPEVHTSITNPLETTASWTSTAATALDDYYYTKKSYYDDQNQVFVVDEATANSFIMSAIGTLIPSALIDGIIDVLASEYNHGNAPSFLEVMDLKGKRIYNLQLGI